jgi:nitric oxide reductase activation protein
MDVSNATKVFQQLHVSPERQRVYTSFLALRQAMAEAAERAAMDAGETATETGWDAEPDTLSDQRQGPPW